MHHISNIKVKNFRSISEQSFSLSTYTPLVGYNNAGKTNIMRAIEWIINRASLTRDSFHREDKPVIVEAEVSGVTEEILDAIESTHKKKIEPFVVDGRIQFKRTQDKPGQSIREIHFEVHDGSGWINNPAGIDNAISALFPDPIFIGAMEDATEDVGKFGAGTVIGKLLKEIMDDVITRHSPSVAEALEEVGRKLSANSNEKDESLANLDNSIQKQLIDLFPGVSAKIHIPVPEFSGFIKSATIRIFEDEYESPDGRDVSSLGHGTQRSIQIALVQCLAETGKEAKGKSGRTTLLLIDEPELYLHPQAIEVVRAALKRLANNGYQVVMSTHSANMISRSDAPSTLLIRKNTDKGTHCYGRMEDAVRLAIKDADSQSQTLFALSNSSKILFSDRVVIVEGKTERIILPEIFHKKFNSTPDEVRLGFVEIGGSANVPNAMKVLESMSVPCKAIVDLDFAFRVAVKEFLIDPEDVNISKCKSVLKELEESGKIDLNDQGLPNKNSSVSAAKAFELLANHDSAKPFILKLHEELKSKGVWMWTMGTIESHLGIEKGSNAQRVFIENLKDDPSKVMTPGYKIVVEAMEWLQS